MTYRDPGGRMMVLKIALQTIGLSKRHVAQTCQLLAAILHLGNLDFIIDRNRDEDAAVVRNTDVCAFVADFLGVHPSHLEQSLACHSKMVKKEMCTIFLDPEGASENRDELAKALYSLLFSWLNEHINQRFPHSLDQFCINFANERLHHWTQRRLFDSHIHEYGIEGISHFQVVLAVQYFDNTELVFTRRRPILQWLRHSRSVDHSSFNAGTIDRSGFPTFTVIHFNGVVTYSSEKFIERNQAALNSDFVNLLRGVEGIEDTGSKNPFVKGLFGEKQIATMVHPRNEITIIAAQHKLKPMRAPSTRRKRTKRTATEEDDTEVVESTSGSVETVADEFRLALDTLFETLDDTQSWHVFASTPTTHNCQASLKEGALRVKYGNVFEVNMLPAEFCDRYKNGLEEAGVTGVDERAIVGHAKSALGLHENDIVLGQNKVFLSQATFHLLEDQLRSRDVEDQERIRFRQAEDAGDPYAPYSYPNAEGEASWTAGHSDNSLNQQLPLIANTSPFQRDQSTSHVGSEVYVPSRNMFQNADKANKDILAGGNPRRRDQGETAEVIRESSLYA
ncbi:P-loop containing nucleoside triphosphate hydrolase protein [Gymnopus androsaceus JB14]|uniref:P-loop containing nucleoside triphosphate hydrolase protein n=1 Tax=Gymnopus androsaceus JB14 TaxID=1447944 RepID=A0A6A4IFN7_9AGAR|nr:P-loop containing nucleoside triphosphate hydrolase protein [Gymnopus androsaceus JB14]